MNKTAQRQNPAFIVKHLKNRNGVASPCRTTCTVCGDAPCYAFLSIQLYLAWRLSIIREAGDTDPVAEALLFAAIRVGVFSALGFVLAKGNPRFAGSLVCVVLCFSQF
nr:hypothetical protein [uncultured Cardiobacterium sp.]